MRIPHRGEGVSREDTGDFLQHRAERRRGRARERVAGPARGGERGRLVLGRDGGQHGRLPPADGAAAELDAHGDVGDGLEARGRDGEGRGEGHVERARLGRRHVHGEGLLERAEAERLHGGRRGRGRRDGAEARGGGGGGGLAGGRDEAGPRAGGGGGPGEPDKRRGRGRGGDGGVHGLATSGGWGVEKRRPEAGPARFPGKRRGEAGERRAGALAGVYRRAAVGAAPALDGGDAGPAMSVGGPDETRQKVVTN